MRSRCDRLTFSASPNGLRNAFEATKPKTPKGPPLRDSPVDFVNGLYLLPLVAMPGDDLLFQRLSVSTIGAVRFHGRVRDGIGWFTDAMVTRQWSGRT